MPLSFWASFNEEDNNYVYEIRRQKANASWKSNLKVDMITESVQK